MAALLLSVIVTVLIHIQPSFSQTTTVTPPPPPPPCNSIQLQYTYTSGRQIPPTETDPTRQPYNFKSTLNITNNGLLTLKSWRVFVGFRHKELLVSHDGAVLLSLDSSSEDELEGSSSAVSVGNGTVLAGFPNTDIPTAIDTAGDITKYSIKVELEGTQFGVGPKSGPPMPGDLYLANDGFKCLKSDSNSGTGTMEVCCTKDPNFKSNTTTDDGFLPRHNGDLSIMYDIESTHDLYYDAQVTIENHHPLGRLDYWKLSWDWMRGEFINNMKGAYTDIVDSSGCIYGPQGEFYKGMDFSKVLNCERRPTLIDLPLDRTNDTIFGMVPNCCRNGTILPKSMDPKKSKSVFKLNVQKMPPDANRSELSPPQNWKIKGLLNPDYVCGPPVRVSPSQYPDSSGLPVNKTVVASWQVVCNITKLKDSNPKCCVSFSAFYDESVIPCKTCACGCTTSLSQTCSATSPALLLPSQALLVPFENRTKLTEAWADLKHLPKPNPLPCGDNCGVSINWHLYTDYKRGWTSRVTIFNWDETPFADWFAAVEMGNATLGFEKAYSFNGTAFINGKGDENNTIFLQGLPGLNYIVAESDDVKDPLGKPRVPGKQQSVLSFTKKKTPGISVVEGGDGFPKKVYFNGEECSLPSVLPKSSGYQNGVSLFLAVVLLLLVMQL